MVPPLLGAFAAYVLLWRAARKDWVGFALMVAVALLLMVPFLNASYEDWYAFTKRAKETSVFNVPNWKYPLKDMATKTLLGMHWIGDQNGRHNLVYAPQLSMIPAALTVLGLAYGLLTLANPISRLLILLVFFGLLPDMVTWESPHASRMFDALAPLLILASLAWREVYRALARIPLLGLPVAVLATLIGCWFIYQDDYRLYFKERPASEPFYESFLPDEAFAAEYAGSLPLETTVFVDPQLHSKHNFWFYQGDLTSGNPRKVLKFDVGNMPVRDIDTKDAYFVVMRTGEGLVDWMMDLYPKGELVSGKSPWGRFNFAAVHVTRDQVRETFANWEQGKIRLRHGLLAKYYVGDELVATRQVPRLFDWNLPDATEGRPPTKVVYEGFVRQEKSGPVHIGAHPQNVTITIGDKVWIQGRGAASREDGQYVTHNLQQGIHRFRAEFDHGPGVRVPYFVWLMWRAPGSNLPSPTPFPAEMFTAPPLP
ncbi:MAG: hypothetical protein HUU16_18225 [Candidatus Omnitrophica bacterium]|nr:hypothetical protein [Candidatus Omnitrophota bacterium]